MKIKDKLWVTFLVASVVTQIGFYWNGTNTSQVSSSIYFGLTLLTIFFDILFKETGKVVKK